MRETAVNCHSPTCVAEGASFSRGSRRGQLIALGKCPPPEPVAVDGRVRLRRAVWRYTLLPGLVELDLARSLERLSGVRVTLWPQRDRYDLHVESSDTVWRADVKDWSNAVALADRLRRQQPEAEMYVVLPDRRRHQLAVLRERTAGTGWLIATVSEFVAALRSTLRQEGGDRE